MTKVLDLFCGEGGAGMGYSQCGFEVVGVDSDIAPLSRYPFGSMCADWQRGLEVYAAWADFIHASPPCQRYSRSNPERDRSTRPDLVEPVREALLKTGKPFVIENVPEAPLINPVSLCGGMFGLTVDTHGETFMLQRHRGFEAHGFALNAPMHHAHRHPALSIMDGVSRSFKEKRGWKPSAQVARELMQTPWMTRKGCSESIPPAYTRFIGSALKGLV